jgi:hypothetical protein
LARKIIDGIDRRSNENQFLIRRPRFEPCARAIQPTTAGDGSDREHIHQNSTNLTQPVGVHARR